MKTRGLSSSRDSTLVAAKCQMGQQGVPAVSVDAGQPAAVPDVGLTVLQRERPGIRRPPLSDHVDVLGVLTRLGVGVGTDRTARARCRSAGGGIPSRRRITELAPSAAISNGAVNAPSTVTVGPAGRTCRAWWRYRRAPAATAASTRRASNTVRRITRFGLRPRPTTIWPSRLRRRRSHTSGAGPSHQPRSHCSARACTHPASWPHPSTQQPVPKPAPPAPGALILLRRQG